MMEVLLFAVDNGRVFCADVAKISDARPLGKAALREMNMNASFAWKEESVPIIPLLGTGAKEGELIVLKERSGGNAALIVRKILGVERTRGPADEMAGNLRRLPGGGAIFELDADAARDLSRRIRTGE